MIAQRHLISYGFLGLPLAMVALPVYVQVPLYYTREAGLSLAVTGWVLFAARLIDTFQDPWLGQLIDAMVQRRLLKTVLAFAAVPFILAFLALWLPPDGATALAAWWLAIMLALVYTFHSLLNIAYLSWGARLAGGNKLVTRAAAWRESAGLVGVVLASAGPALLGHAGWSATQSMVMYSALFAIFLVLGLVALLRSAPGWQEQPDHQRVNLRQAWSTPAFRRVLLPFGLNAVAVAIPATLALFFISDRIQAEPLAGMFLAAYFVAGALGLPFWTRLADKVGPARAWQMGMVLAIFAFVWAVFLQAGDVYAYLVVCVLAGLALGADLAMPPVVLARLIPAGQTPAGYYGIWSLLGKLALAVSGLLLPLLAFFGYEPGQDHSNSNALASAYALLPCVLKLFACLSLRPLIQAYSRELS
jgi:Na+/melibiose symporter-like transporter